MRWKKATPEEGGERTSEQFTYTGTQAGLKGVWYAWCAHDPEWFWVHEHKPHARGTKVCTAWFTEGAVRCARCKPGVVPTKVAYVPVWREEDGAPCMVIVHEWAAEKLREVKYGRYVMVSCVETTGGVVVQCASEARPWKSSNPLRQGPCDITVSLLTMWSIPGLDDWCHGRGGYRGPVPKVEAVEPGKYRLSVPPPTTTTEALAIDAERKVPTGGTAGVGDALRRIVRRKDDAERNGKHKPEGGEQ